jgi:hypothetical protein
MFTNFSSFRKSCILWENVEYYCTAGQAKDDTTHAHCMLYK